ncbi:MAG TPA: TlpA disulfide reductase family protein [Burkholderiales bacterium]|nr:TlpA disulfide reductase family protein [Burkholderiales bacterium]
MTQERRDSSRDTSSGTVITPAVEPGGRARGGKTALIAALLALAVTVVSLVYIARQVSEPAAPGESIVRLRTESGPGFRFVTLAEPKPVPQLRFSDKDGRALSLADFRGKVILLNIWATWCPPCRKEMPSLDRLQARLGGPDFEVVAVSIDQRGDALFIVEEFFREIGVEHLRIFLDQTGGAARTVGALGLPVTLLVDRRGRELGRLVGPAEWDSPEAIATIRQYLSPPARSG